MNIRKIPLLLLVLIAFSACTQEKKEKPALHFFAIRSYFEKQITDLTNQHTSLQKRITKDGTSEEKIQAQPDWKKELRPFTDCDINRPAWFKGYRIDTLQTISETHLLYTALEEKLAVRKMDIALLQDSVQSITIMLEKKNAYFNSSQSLMYIPGKSYRINGSQKVIMADPINYEINAVIN